MSVTSSAVNFFAFTEGIVLHDVVNTGFIAVSGYSSFFFFFFFFINNKIIYIYIYIYIFIYVSSL